MQKPFTPFSIGTRVFAFWDDGYWYPATVTNFRADKVAVLYDDPYTEWIRLAYVLPMLLTQDDIVEYRPTSYATYQVAVVRSVTGGQVQLQVEGTSSRWVKFSALRMTRDLPISPETAQRFFTLVEKTDTCWWMPKVDIKRSGNHRHTSYNQLDGYFVHRLAYTVANGYIPSKHFVRHRCNNKGCVNPAHLMVGEPWENVFDEVARRRHGKQPGELFSYEDDLEYFINLCETEQKRLPAEQDANLDHKLKTLQAKCNI